MNYVDIDTSLHRKSVLVENLRLKDILLDHSISPRIFRLAQAHSILNLTSIGIDG